MYSRCFDLRIRFFFTRADRGKEISRYIRRIKHQISTISERPKRPNVVSAETEILARLTETSAEISAEIQPKITWKQGYILWDFLNSQLRN